MSIHGDLYYEGKEFETKLKDKKPGDLSDELRAALGMPTGPVSGVTLVFEGMCSYMNVPLYNCTWLYGQCRLYGSSVSVLCSMWQRMTCVRSTNASNVS